MSNLTFIAAASQAAARLIRRDDLFEDRKSKSEPSRKDYTLTVSETIPSTFLQRVRNPFSILSSSKAPVKGHGAGSMSIRSVDQNGKPYGDSKTKEVYAKWAGDSERLSKLVHEAGLYCNDLKSLQGSVVPRCYGFFTDSVKDPKFGVLVLELCSGTYPVDSDELNRVIMVTGCKLHTAGINHGQLHHNRHFVPYKGSLRIVDFTLAENHSCSNAHPDVGFGTKRNRNSECDELVMLEKMYGKYSGGVSKKRYA